MSAPTEMERVLRVALRVRGLLEAGVPVREAIDRVCGAGTFARIADETYEALRGARR